MSEYNIYDNHGNIYCESTIDLQQRNQQRQMITNQVENVGDHFKIKYNDNNLTVEYINVVKDVLLNLESLVNFSDMCSRIVIKLSTNNLGDKLASNHYYYTGTPSGVIYGSLWRSINLGRHFPYYDAEIIFNQNKLNEFYTGNASNNTDVPNDKYYFYAIVQHQLIHAMGFDSFLKWSQDDISKVTKFDTLLKNNSDYILNSTPLSWTYNININNFEVPCGNTISTTTEIPLYTTNNTVLDTTDGMCHIHTNEPYLNPCGNGVEINKLMALKLTKGRYVELSTDEIDVLNSIGYNSSLVAFDFPNCSYPYPPIIDRCNTFTLNINEITNNVNARFNQFFTFNDGVDITMDDENLFVNSDFARYSLIIGYNLIDNNNNVSNVGFMNLRFKVCDSHTTSFGCDLQADDCELICNGDLIKELVDTNYSPYQNLIGYPEMISGFYCFNGTPDYNRLDTSINTFSLFEQEGVMAKVNEITTHKKYILTFKANKKQSNINPNLRIFLTNTNYPNPSKYWDNVYEDEFNSTNSQNIEPQITINNTLLENYLYCFESNNDFDVLVFSGKGSLNFLQIGEFDLVEDKMFDDNYFETAYDINCNANTIGSQLCDVPNMRYSWFDITNGVEIQLTDGLSILPDGEALGIAITTSNTNGSSIDINNIDTDKTFEIRKIFDNNVNVTCNEDRVEVDIHVIVDPTITLTYESSQFCAGDNNPVPNSILLTGGTFTINNGGIIDELTGEIDLLSSGLGDFEVVYTTSCGSVNFQIHVVDDCVLQCLIPDILFENYLETHNALGDVVVVGDSMSLGNGIIDDGIVNNVNIENVTSLNTKVSHPIKSTPFIKYFLKK